jgi:hypothetical protein
MKAEATPLTGAGDTLVVIRGYASIQNVGCVFGTSRCPVVHLIEVLTVSPNWQSLMSSCCNCHRRTLRSARFLDRGLELMRQCFDDARAETGMWGLAVSIV